MNLINMNLFILLFIFSVTIISSANSQQYNSQPYFNPSVYQKNIVSENNAVNTQTDTQIEINRQSSSSTDNYNQNQDNKIQENSSQDNHYQNQSSRIQNNNIQNSNIANNNVQGSPSQNDQSTTKQIVYSHVSNTRQNNGVKNNDNRTRVENISQDKTVRVEKAKAELIDKHQILKEDLTLVKWSEFDHHGFNITISTPNVFNEDSIVNIKWKTVDEFEPSSSIKIELHANLTRRDDYIAYPTTETIIIDDNIPSDINEVNWNPYIKFKKNEKYFIRVWAYTNNNTATMSGLCLWSVNTILVEDIEKVKTDNVEGNKNYFKTVGFPAIGALLCFTVIGHFVYESKKNNKYHNISGNNSDVDSHDGLNNYRGEQIYYDAIKVEESERNYSLPQPWELEAKRKLTLTRQNNQLSLSDGSDNYQRLIDGSDNYEDISVVLDEENNEPISLTIEKPSIPKLPKLPKYPIDNPLQNRQHHKHHHHHRHNSSVSSYDSRGNRKSLVDSIIISKNRN
ncbi:hypothetical protein BCR36DRAFT_345072 [Piromyces finnis]|uniref:Fibronectin type-III domain-containing protein n=1 Tax=Piromyces finnis TaxID=1754191 RepID=A0A1Y1VJ10_9FUNG|nr:hypothetical protein BCR36DRAFT_345072 [Piromyces finnis]|eukprot:ORX57159.1 hypothetical protein BCR36DRAFT_345072 [Piromyces finnis]